MPVIRTAADLSRQMTRLDDAVGAFSEHLRELGSAVGGWRPRPIPPGTLSGIQSSGQVLYNLLDIQFEDPNQAKALAKYVRRIKNLRKMVGKFKDAKSDEELAEVYANLSSKSKSAWQKFIEYRREVLSLVGTLDTEPAGQFRLGGMSVALIRTGARGFTSEEIVKAKAVLTKAERYLQQRGLGELTKGLTVFIYPTAGIPGRPSANAWYDRKDDTAAIAVGSAWFKKSSVNRMVQTMVHELGHRAYYRMTSNNGRRMWEAFYEEMQEPPDVDGMIRDWDAFVADAYDEKDRRRRSHFSGPEGWYNTLNKQDREAATWLLMAVGNFNLDSGEKFDNRHGFPTVSSVPALDALKARKSEIMVFAEPVTAYSSTSAHELFAEAFAHYLAYGPRTLSPRLRGQFQRTLPKMKMASLAKAGLSLPVFVGRGASAVRVASRYMASSPALTLQYLDAELGENEDLPEEIGSEHFDEIAELLEDFAPELDRGDYSLVLDFGDKVVKVMTDSKEARTLKQIMGSNIPSLPKVYAVDDSIFFDLHFAMIKKYKPLPRGWRDAIRGFIQHIDADHNDPEEMQEIAEEYGLEPHAVRSFYAAIDALPFTLRDWKIANVMWDEQHKVPVLIDLGDQ